MHGGCWGAGDPRHRPRPRMAQAPRQVSQACRPLLASDRRLYCY
jgi:hypothetical protein